MTIKKGSTMISNKKAETILNVIKNSYLSNIKSDDIEERSQRIEDTLIFMSEHHDNRSMEHIEDLANQYVWFRLSKDEESKKWEKSQDGMKFNRFMSWFIDNHQTNQYEGKIYLDRVLRTTSYNLDNYYKGDQNVVNAMDAHIDDLMPNHAFDPKLKGQMKCHLNKMYHEFIHGYLDIQLGSLIEIQQFEAVATYLNLNIVMNDLFGDSCFRNNRTSYLRALVATRNEYRDNHVVLGAWASPIINYFQ